MADAILYGVAQKIIESLGSSALQHVGSICGVKDELEKMKNTVLTIQVVLQDAEEQQVQNHQVKHWLMKLREVVFDADDLLSEFSTHVLRQNVMEGSKMTKKVRVFFSSSNQLVFDFKMAHKIKAMRERLNDIAKDRNNFQLVEHPLGTAVVTRKRDQTHSFVREEDVIGREEDKEAIIGKLLDSDVGENVSFISIVGIGGLGKTTLVQYIYNDEKVKAYFELKMWVCVSNDFDVKTIVERIITSATGKKPKNLDMDQLQIELREKLSQKKYLLVLDDVWNEDKEIWCNLKTLLLDGSKGSKVVITTRNNLVADITGTMHYFLKGLSNDQSWSLLKQMAFEKKQDTINPNFEAIGRDIVEKCCGMPLAIKAIGRVLYYKKTESEWSYIKDSELKNVIKLKDDIFPILKLSYDHLPPHLKCCFAYCSLFPKDYLIKKLTLIQLWIAQGFIQSQDENLRLEDIANEYFEDLLWRSFFQVEHTGASMYEDTQFKMHDLVHDLALSISRIECALVDSNAKNVNEKSRHLSCAFKYNSFFEENLNSLVKAKKMRTFLLTSHGLNRPVEVSALKTLISTFRYLRALDLHDLKIKTLPNIIGKLMHLMYLDLSENDIEVLPSSITRLVNLHTLKLYWCRKLKELPIDIQKLVSLKHLDINFCSNLTHMPYGLGQLTSLQTLPLFVVSKDPIGSSKHCGGLAELNKLNHLRGIIRITNLELVKDAISATKAANLKEKQHLSGLTLRWNSRLDDVINAGDDENLLDGLQPPQNLKYLSVAGYKGVRFSNWLSSLTNLTELEMYGCKKCQHLPPLYQFPSLRKIELQEMHSLEYISDLDITNEVSASSLTTFFPSLESLFLYDCPNLKGWWKRDNGDATIMTSTSSSSHQYHQHISLPSFPCLSCLEINGCSKLTSMPLFPYLEERLSLESVSWKALQPTILAMKMNTAGASSLPSSIPPLSKLRELALLEMLDKEPLPEEWLQNLTSLEVLTIRRCSTSLSHILRHLTSLKWLSIDDCEEVDLFSDADDDGTKFQHVKCLQSLSFTKISKLESLPAYLQSVITLRELSIVECPSLMTLPEWIGNLTSLQYLKIEDCPNLTSLPEGMRRLTSLQSLRISKISKLESLPAYLQSVTTLRYLSIEKCPGLMTLPEWIGNLASLQNLEIEDCPNLTSLPEGMRRLTSLQSLRIYRCPHLEQRCQKEIGEDWTKIAHVPKYSNKTFLDAMLE